MCDTKIVFKCQHIFLNLQPEHRRVSKFSQFSNYTFLLANGLPRERGLISRKRHLVVDNANRLAFLLWAEPENRCRLQCMYFFYLVCTPGIAYNFQWRGVPVAVSFTSSEREFLALPNLAGWFNTHCKFLVKLAVHSQDHIICMHHILNAYLVILIRPAPGRVEFSPWSSNDHFVNRPLQGPMSWDMPHTSWNNGTEIFWGRMILLQGVSGFV